MSALPASVTITITPVHCTTCGGWFGLDEHFERAARTDGRSFTCPYGGHTLSWHNNSENDRLKRKTADLELSLKWAREARDEAQDRADRSERRRRATAGVLTKVRKRVGHGVCPVAGCKRHFANLDRHMKTEHPAYQPDAEVG